MKEWIINTTNKITVLWNEPNPNLMVQYKSLDTNSSWVNIGVPIYINDNIHTIEKLFTNTGNYIIRVMDTDTLHNVIERLDIVDECACNEVQTGIIEDRIDTLDGGLRQILSNLGDEINENEVIITNRTKTMVMTI